MIYLFFLDFLSSHIFEETIIENNPITTGEDERIRFVENDCDQTANYSSSSSSLNAGASEITNRFIYSIVFYFILNNVK